MKFWVMGSLVSVAGAAFISGCAPGRVDLFDSGVVRLEKVPDKRGYYRDIHAYSNGDGMQVVGHVRRSIQPAHMHVEVQDSAGKTIERARAEVRPILRSSRARHARFEAFLPVPASDSSVVRIRHHVGQCNEAEPENLITPTDRGGA